MAFEGKTNNTTKINNMTFLLFICSIMQDTHFFSKGEGQVGGITKK